MTKQTETAAGERRTAMFYSYDGRIWYWSKFSADDIAIGRHGGMRFMRDTPRNRRKLS